MLSTLRIQNYALIDTLEIDFQQGFNVLTGETGAGKSILLGALNLILGARASSDGVRVGTRQAQIEGIFHLPSPSARLQALFADHDLELEDDCLLVSRTVTKDGRSKAYAGGTLVPLSVLAAIGDELIDLHGQHEHQSLLKTDRQLALLDAFAGVEQLALEVGEAVQQWRTATQALEALQGDERERERRMDLLRHEVKEIKAAGFEPGEEEAIVSQRSRANNAEAIHELASRAHNRLYAQEEDAVVDQLDGTLRDLEALVEIDGTYIPLLEQLTEARSTVEAVALEVRDAAEGVDFDGGALEELNQRKTLLQDLKRKYGENIEAIHVYCDKATEELAGYENRDARMAALKAEAEQCLDKAMKLAGHLHKKRVAAAKKLEKQVSASMQELEMKGAQFVVELSERDLGRSGVDKITFLLAANAGDTPKPLRKVASGGEMSRIMLAMKAVFAAADAIPTLIFDEVDAGIGGAVARKVAAKLQGLATSHQVLCVTHLAQIAAVGNTHFAVTKSSQRGTTRTQVINLDENARVEEIARLLDGSVSELSVKHAKELLSA